MRCEQVCYLCCMLRHLLARAIHFAQQNGRGIPGIAGMGKVLCRLYCQAVHHLQPGGNNAGGDDRAHGIAGRADAIEAGHDHLGQLRRGQQAHGDFRHDAQQAFRAGEQRQQVVAGTVQAHGCRSSVPPRRR